MTGIAIDIAIAAESAEKMVSKIKVNRASKCLKIKGG